MYLCIYIYIYILYAHFMCRFGIQFVCLYIYRVARTRGLFLSLSLPVVQSIRSLPLVHHLHASAYLDICISRYLYIYIQYMYIQDACTYLHILIHLYNPVNTVNIYYLLSGLVSAASLYCCLSVSLIAHFGVLFFYGGLPFTSALGFRV